MDERLDQNDDTRGQLIPSLPLRVLTLFLLSGRAELRVGDTEKFR